MVELFISFCYILKHITTTRINLFYWWLFTWASYQMRKIADCAWARNAGNVFPPYDFKGKRKLALPACITARASRTCRDAYRGRSPAVVGETCRVFPAHAQPATLHIWQEAHAWRGHTSQQYYRCDISPFITTVDNWYDKLPHVDGRLMNCQDI